METPPSYYGSDEEVFMESCLHVFIIEDVRNTRVTFPRHVNDKGWGLEQEKVMCMGGEYEGKMKVGWRRWTMYGFLELERWKVWKWKGDLMDYDSDQELKWCERF